MRGELFIGFASILSLAALMLLIFSHVGQINTSNVPRNIYMASVNMSQYGDALHEQLIDTIDIYTLNASAPLMVGAGLRQFYRFGLYDYCAYVTSDAGICSEHTFGAFFKPYDAITGDMSFNFSNITNAIITDTTFRDSDYLADYTRAAFWLIFLGTLCAAATFFIGIPKRSYTFFMSTVFAILSSILLLIGAAIWTVMIKKSESVNGFFIGTQSNHSPIGIVVSLGPGVLMIWAAFACMVASIIPYMITCCTFRG